MQGKEAIKKPKFTEEQILFALKQVAAGQPVADVCRQMGISEATFYNWKSKLGGMDVSGFTPYDPETASDVDF